MTGHRLDEQAVNAINLGFQKGMGFAGDRLMRVEIVLALAREHGGVVNAVLRILLGLVDVHRNDANRADTTGARNEHPTGGARQCVGS